jgi:hypothetical protein
MQRIATTPPAAGIVSARATFPVKMTVTAGIEEEGIDMTTGTTRLTIRMSGAEGGSRTSDIF